MNQLRHRCLDVRYVSDWNLERIGEGEGGYLLLEVSLLILWFESFHVYPLDGHFLLVRISSGHTLVHDSKPALAYLLDNFVVLLQGVTSIQFAARGLGQIDVR